MLEITLRYLRLNFAVIFLLLAKTFFVFTVSSGSLLSVFGERSVSVSKTIAKHMHACPRTHTCTHLCTYISNTKGYGYFVVNGILSLEAILLLSICDWSIVMTC